MGLLQDLGAVLQIHNEAGYKPLGQTTVTLQAIICNKPVEFYTAEEQKPTLLSKIKRSWTQPVNFTMFFLADTHIHSSASRKRLTS